MRHVLTLTVIALSLSLPALAEGERRNQMAEPSMPDKAFPLISTNAANGSVLSEGKNPEGVPIAVQVGTRRNDDGSYTRTITDVNGKTHTSTYSR